MISEHVVTNRAVVSAPCAFCTYLLAVPNSARCPECGKVTPERLRDVPSSLRVKWETRLGSSFPSRFLRTLFAAWLRYDGYLHVLQFRRTLPIYQDAQLAICFIASLASVPVLSWLLGLILLPMLRYGFPGLSKWITFWQGTMKNIYYHLPFMIPATIIYLVELLLLGAMIVLIARAHKRQMTFSLAICAVGPPTIAVFLLQSVAVNLSATLASGMGWQATDFLFYIIVLGSVLAIGTCVGLAVTIALRVPWYSGAIAGIFAAAMTWQLPGLVSRLWDAGIV